MLRMNAHDAKISIAVAKLNDQVQNMQMKLMENEEKLNLVNLGLINPVVVNDVDEQKKNEQIEELYLELRENTSKAKNDGSWSGSGGGSHGADDKTVRDTPSPLLSLEESIHSTKEKIKKRDDQADNKKKEPTKEKEKSESTKLSFEKVYQNARDDNDDSSKSTSDNVNDKAVVNIAFVNTPRMDVYSDGDDDVTGPSNTQSTGILASE